MSLQEAAPAWANQTKSFWTEEKTERLIEMHAEGKLSCAGMARELGTASRNAVIGKLSRLGLCTSKTVAEQRRRIAVEKKLEEQATRKAASPHLAFETIVSERRKQPKSMLERMQRAAELRAKFECLEIIDLPPDQSAMAVSFSDLSDQTCRWPLGDPRDLESMKFCGDKPYQEYSYCKRHCLQAYRLPEKVSRKSTFKPSRLTAAENW